MYRFALPTVVLVLLVSPVFGAAPGGEEDGPRIGHSGHGDAFDEGPRQKPWKMDGIGTSHFEVTSSVPEVQAWFDQGNTLLHSFWYFEAERSFRWCLKLDPDCAMAYWGMARANIEFGETSERMLEFLREAVSRKHLVSDREQQYIEAWATAFLPEWSKDIESVESSPWMAYKVLGEEVEKLVLAYPDDLEAKALLALVGLFNPMRYANEAVIREIIAVNPDHPGAHHYRIHTWDGEDGAMAIDSCEIYGRLARNSGHANHMPGHIYSGIGMWHEGAIWMDSATRVEKRYMQKRMTLPYHNWNYAHNRNYLSYIQEQLGMPALAIDGAHQLLRAPHDPKYNDHEKPYSIRNEGLQALLRVLIKFERWDEIMDGETITWTDVPTDQFARHFAECLVHIANGDVVQAVAQRTALSKVKLPAPPTPMPGEPAGPDRIRKRMLNELGGRIAILRGETLEGLRLLDRAAQEQSKHYHNENDPPAYPHIIYNILGELHLDLGSPGQAAMCFEKALESNTNDGFALSGLARARHHLGDTEGARMSYGKLLHVWSDADPNLRWLTAVEALDIDVEPIDDGPRPERNYASQTLDPLGPQQWQPYDAPALSALDSTRASVALDEYAGRNVLLVFYLGESCVHCVEQLHAIGAKSSDFDQRDVAMLAISSNTPEEHARSLKLGDLPFRLIADIDHENARRFHAFDDFEDLELHATILIDRLGRIHWARMGGDPFMDVDFLLSELDRMNAASSADAVAATGVDPG